MYFKIHTKSKTEQYRSIISSTLGLLMHFEPTKCNLIFILGVVAKSPNNCTIQSNDFKIIRSICKIIIHRITEHQS